MKEVATLKQKEVSTEERKIDKSAESFKAAQGIKTLNEWIKEDSSLFAGQEEPYFNRAKEHLSSSRFTGTYLLKEHILELLKYRSEGILISLLLVEHVKRNKEIEETVKKVHASMMM